MPRWLPLSLVLLWGCPRSVPLEDVFRSPAPPEPAPASVQSPAPNVASPRRPPPFQLAVSEGWVYFARCAPPRGRCEVGRVPIEGGPEQPLASSGQIGGFAVDSRFLYLLESRQVVSVELSGRVRRLLAQAEGIPMQLGTAAGRVFWSEANPPRLCVVDREGGEETEFSNQVDVPALFLALKEEVLVVDGDRQTGRLVLSRLATDASDPGVRMRADQRGEVPSSMAVDGPTLYWSSMARSGNSHLWKAPRAFGSGTRPEELPVGELGLGVHDLGIYGPDLYFLDSKGPARVPKQGGPIERLGSSGTSLAAGPGGVFVGTLDGQILRVDGPRPH